MSVARIEEDKQRATMASDDAAMDVEQNEEGLEQQTEQKQEELDPIALMEAKLQRINALIETPQEELSEKVFPCCPTSILTHHTDKF